MVQMMSAIIDDRAVRITADEFEQLRTLPETERQALLDEIYARSRTNR